MKSSRVGDPRPPYAASNREARDTAQQPSSAKHSTRTAQQGKRVVENLARRYSGSRSLLAMLSLD